MQIDTNFHKDQPQATSVQLLAPGVSSNQTANNVSQHTRVGNIRTEEIYPYADVRLATWSPEWEERAKALLLPLPRSLGYAHLDVPWALYLTTMFLPAFRDDAAFGARQDGLQEKQRTLSEGLVRNNALTVEDLQNMDGKNAQMAFDELEKRLVKEAHKGHAMGERIASFAKNAIIAIPLVAVLTLTHKCQSLSQG